MIQDPGTYFEPLFKGIQMRTAEPMRKHTSFRVGGPAELMVLPRTKEEVTRALGICRDKGLAATVVGGGTNILVSDSGIRDVVISLCNLKQDITHTLLDSNRVRLDIPAGHTMASVIRLSLQEGLEGAEFAAGIPGTVGGAVMMNAGIPSWSISDILESIEVTDSRTGTTRVEKKELEFSYRAARNVTGVVTTVSLVLFPGNRDIIKKRVYRNYMKKKATQPLLQKSAGCFFKNPANGKPAGELIELCGLKGKQVGDAMVSSLHANFLLNAGNATCRDIIQLRDIVQKEVFRSFSVELQPEVIIKDE